MAYPFSWDLGTKSAIQNGDPLKCGTRRPLWFLCFFPWLLFLGTSLPKKGKFDKRRLSPMLASWVCNQWSWKMLTMCHSLTTFSRCKKSDFPGGPVVKTRPFHCRGNRFDPWWGKFCMQCGMAKKKKKTQCHFYMLTTYLRKAKLKKNTVLFIIFKNAKCPPSMNNVVLNESWYELMSSLMWPQVDLCLCLHLRLCLCSYVLSTRMYK